MLIERNQNLNNQSILTGSTEDGPESLRLCLPRLGFHKEDVEENAVICKTCRKTIDAKRSSSSIWFFCPVNSCVMSFLVIFLCLLKVKC